MSIYFLFDIALECCYYLDIVYNRLYNTTYITPIFDTLYDIYNYVIYTTLKVNKCFNQKNSSKYTIIHRNAIDYTLHNLPKKILITYDFVLCSDSIEKEEAKEYIEEKAVILDAMDTIHKYKMYTIEAYISKDENSTYNDIDIVSTDTISFLSCELHFKYHDKEELIDITNIMNMLCIPNVNNKITVNAILRLTDIFVKESSYSIESCEEVCLNYILSNMKHRKILLNEEYDTCEYLENIIEVDLHTLNDVSYTHHT